MPNVYTFKDFIGSSHRILIDLIRRQGPGNLFIDLGAAGGELARSVAPQFRRRIGYEYNIDCIESLAHSFDSGIVANLENATTLPRNADAIVLADVLEHLRNQKNLLALVRESIRPGGRVYVSVPNIANITIRIGLLFGIFTYRERGILDETHVRFYTMHTIRKELEGAGFRILTVRGSSVPIRLIVGQWMPGAVLVPFEWLLLRLTNGWKSLMAYQLILVVERDDRR